MTRIVKSNDGARMLSAAIIKQATVDYRGTLEEIESGKCSSLNYQKTSMIYDCEKFFRSEWFDLLADELNGERIIKQIREDVKKRILAKKAEDPVASKTGAILSKENMDDGVDMLRAGADIQVPYADPVLETAMA